MAKNSGIGYDLGQVSTFSLRPHDNTWALEAVCLLLQILSSAVANESSHNT